MTRMDSHPIPQISGTGLYAFHVAAHFSGQEMGSWHRGDESCALSTVDRGDKGRGFAPLTAGRGGDVGVFATSPAGVAAAGGGGGAKVYRAAASTSGVMGAMSAIACSSNVCLNTDANQAVH